MAHAHAVVQGPGGLGFEHADQAKTSALRFVLEIQIGAAFGIVGEQDCAVEFLALGAGHLARLHVAGAVALAQLLQRGVGREVAGQDEVGGRGGGGRRRGGGCRHGGGRGGCGRSGWSGLGCRALAGGQGYRQHRCRQPSTRCVHGFTSRMSAEPICQARCSGVAPSTTARRST
ncbi:hypothetical protein DX914_09695 [Lysobacter silvisoli]|uniref:Uncharacterized protein n=1 Tax=Lysobacter silvisoli TaxID=2293254 RepID=A0A371K646_9GAMM|nr:hypothetical protein DX914_09695 [Lysobacter silvisoli]